MHIYPHLIFFSIFLMAGAAILYELLLASALSYLLGATVLYFSLTIGIFLFALGIGAWFSKYIVEDLLKKFLTLEIILGILGGFAITFIFLLYAFFFDQLREIFLRNQVEAFLYSSGFTIWFQGLSFLYLFGIGVLVGVELPILTRLTHEFSVLREALAKVFFWDYLGALAASILFPLLFLPWLGFLKTGFLVGILNIFAAAILALAMRERPFLENFSYAGKILFLAGIAALILGFIFSPRIEEFFTEKIFAQNSILINKTTPYQNIIVSKNPKGEISLFLNWEMQFRSGPLEKEYHETFAHPVMSFLASISKSNFDGKVLDKLEQSFDKAHDRHSSSEPFDLAQDKLSESRSFNILILGGGDGLLLRELWKYPEIEKVTLVDIDPEVTSLAKNNPLFTELNKNSMSDPRLTIINADAFKWLLDRQIEEKFDAIFIDFPDPTDDGLRRLYSREFYMLVRRNLKSDGLAVVQADSLPAQSHEVTKKTIQSAGFLTLSIHTPQLNQELENSGIFDAAFVAASPNPNTIDGLYSNLRGSPFLAPYLDLGYSESPAINSLFRPVDFKYQRGMFTRFLFLQPT